MSLPKKIVSEKAFKIFVVLFCTFVAGCIVAVLSLAYKPDKNSLEALGTVCMDVICMLILIMLVINMAFEREELGKTTKLFLGLMLATMFALFLDFMTWSFDGSLAYGHITYFYILTSLCMGAILAAIFILYLGSYMVEMYEMKSVTGSARICFICNLEAFIITIALAITGNAFVIIDGHYQTGPLYDYVAAIPVLTLIYMTIYAIRHIKVIGAHDVIAIAGYIVTMIAGVAIESIYVVGTTYVSVTVADIFIYVMLQNKILDRVSKQKDALAARIDNQYQVLESMAGIYSHINYIDLEEQTARRFDSLDEDITPEHIEWNDNPHTSLNIRLYEGIVGDLKDKFWLYTNLKTLTERMGTEKIISAEFFHRQEGWIRAQYIRIGDSVDEPLSRVIYAVQNINEEKKNVEKWIQKSNTDELTGFLNRHAFEDEIAVLKKEGLASDFVYMSFDVNSLKIANDMLGHDAGDELLLGASACIEKCFGEYGKLYRTGGDEFVALINANESQLEAACRQFKEVTNNWSGKYNQKLTISAGIVAYAEDESQTLHQMAVLADKRMYDDKAKFYQKKGVDRRGQQDAHVALCATYTKILKINITEDTYQIVNLDEDEKTADKGYSEKISEWLYDFGATGQVHPEDLEQYRAHTSMEYISNYFKENTTALKIFYRRKYVDSYRPVMMEMIPSNDYTDDMQNLYLYVKSL